MSTETRQEELTILRQRVEELEKALLSASCAVKEQDSQDTETFLELQHKLSFLIQRNPLAIISWNTAFEVTDWNPAAESIFGYTKLEALGRHPAGLLIPESAREQVNQVFTALLKQKGGTHSTNGNVTKDGRIITCEWSNTPLTDCKGNVIGIISMVKDITVRKEMEVALSHSEARYKKLVANVPGMIYQFRLEPNGIASFPYVSDACREIYEIEPEAAQQNGALLTEAVHPDDVNAFLNSVAFSAQTLETWDWEGRMFSLSGKCKWIRGISRPELQPDGAILWDGLLIDVSDRNEAQLAVEQAKAELEIRVEERTAELKRSQQLLQLVFDTLPQRVFWKDRNFKFLGCNKWLLQDVGLCSLEEIIGKDDFEMPWKASAHLYRVDDIATIENNCPKINYDELLQKEDGTVIWLRTNKIPLRNEAGETIGIFGSYEDISDRKKAQAALAESEARLRNIAATIPGAIFQLCNHHGIWSVEYISDRIIDFFGVTAGEIMQNTDAFISRLHPDDLSSFMISVAKAGKKRTPWHYEGRLIKLDGEIRWWQGEALPRQGKDGETIFSGVIIDISDRKQAEEAIRRSEAQLRQQALELEQTLKELQRTQSQLIQSEKMSSLGQLVAGVAHEINNPVNFIYGNLDHAYQYTEDLLNIVNLYQTHYPNPVEKIQDKAEAIDLDFLLKDLPNLYSSMKVGATRIREIVASLRTFSRLDEADLKKADIHEGIDSTLMILQYRLKAKQNRPEITVIKEYGNLPLIECYAGQLNQVFMNILANAIDALEESLVMSQKSLVEEQEQKRNPEIRVSTQLSDRHQLVIRIVDNGSGMSEQVRQRLFDPFYTTKPVGKGTGMGLSISYQIVTERHQGILQCISSAGQGAEFVITIPVQQSEKS
jgi:PAS domain S-box-containing protein